MTLEMDHTLQRSGRSLEQTEQHIQQLLGAPEQGSSDCRPWLLDQYLKSYFQTHCDCPSRTSYSPRPDHYGEIQFLMGLEYPEQQLLLLTLCPTLGCLQICKAQVFLSQPVAFIPPRERDPAAPSRACPSRLAQRRGLRGPSIAQAPRRSLALALSLCSLAGYARARSLAQLTLRASHSVADAGAADARIYTVSDNVTSTPAAPPPSRSQSGRADA